jgi:hypothetical protein
MGKLSYFYNTCGGGFRAKSPVFFIKAQLFT